MKRIFEHPLFLSSLVVAALYIVFAYVLDPPLPQSLLIQFMVICVVGVLLVVSFDDATAARFNQPFQALFGNPKLGFARAIAGIVVVAGLGSRSVLDLGERSTTPSRWTTARPDLSGVSRP